jgi:hypothetical protein
MEEASQPQLPSIPIPEAFWSTETGTPFSHCVECHQDLSRPGTPYLIEKAYRGSEPILEFAICLPCVLKAQKQLSALSRQRIEEYFLENAHLAERQECLAGGHQPDLSAWLDKCLFKDTPIQPGEEYQIYAQCDGGLLFFSHHPYAVGHLALEELSELLSAETKGFFDDFVGRHFGIPDGIDLPKPMLV